MSVALRNDLWGHTDNTSSRAVETVDYHTSLESFPLIVDIYTFDMHVYSFLFLDCRWMCLVTHRFGHVPAGQQSSLYMRDTPMVQVFLWAASCSDLPGALFWPKLLKSRAVGVRLPNKRELTATKRTGEMETPLRQRARENFFLTANSFWRKGSVRARRGEHSVSSGEVGRSVWVTCRIPIHVDLRENLFPRSCFKVKREVWGWEVFPS